MHPVTPKSASQRFLDLFAPLFPAPLGEYQPLIQGEIPSGKKLHQIKGRREEGGVRERGKRLGVGDVGIKITNGKQTFFFTALKAIDFLGFLENC